MRPSHYQLPLPLSQVVPQVSLVRSLAVAEPTSLLMFSAEVPQPFQKSGSTVSLLSPLDVGHQNIQPTNYILLDEALLFNLHIDHFCLYFSVFGEDMSI
jgi:hypothetical protein